MAWLKSVWLDCRFSWLINPEWAPLLKGNRDVGEIVPFPRQRFRGTAGSLRFVRWCKDHIAGRKPTLALDFQGLLRSALIGRVSGARALYGMADAREGARWLYHRRSPMPVGAVHAVDRYLQLAGSVLRWSQAGDGTPPQAEPCFPLPEGDAPGGLAGSLPRDFVLLHPFARGTGKSLTVPQVEAFCRRLAPRQVVLVGRRGENQVNVPDAVADLLDRTSLLELVWLIRRASCVVSVDSGPSHLAAALGKPMVAIHTWSDPRRVGPYRQDAWVWKSGRLLTMGQMPSQEEGFFKRPPAPLSAGDIDAICQLAISLSNSCA